MSQTPGGLSPVGQVSADGQFQWDGRQWVPIARGHREPTPWTRPMQLIVAGFFLIEALISLITTFAFINHDSMLKAIQAQGTQIPAGTTVDTIVNFAIATTYAVVIFFVILEVVGAVGSYLGWRWMFWVALVLFGLGAIGTFTNLGNLFSPDKSPEPIAAIAVTELFSVASLGVFVWMLIGVFRYGPWAMRKPGAETPAIP